MHQYDPVKFGRRVRDIRNRLGWTQQELAEAGGLSRNVYVSEIERGRATGLSVDALMPLAGALAEASGVDVCDMMCTLLMGPRQPATQGDRWVQQLADALDGLPDDRKLDMLLLARLWQGQQLMGGGDDGVQQKQMELYGKEVA